MNACQFLGHKVLLLDEKSDDFSGVDFILSQSRIFSAGLKYLNAEKGDDHILSSRFQTHGILGPIKSAC